jgi:hypothetical protein
MSKVLHATCYKVGFPGEFDDFGVATGAPKVLHATKWLHGCRVTTLHRVAGGDKSGDKDPEGRTFHGYGRGIQCHVFKV